ncbi:hypothetical protein IFM89_012609 [Coptis chinensis]|uniref:Glutamate synthase domain-containing protein n=1 Tax=Coptis chinensis TaxID=261450 RepID=A0A835IQF4_9MAGN|nr:hypothetical protein IFM89_012609 [Coptis chinensis]
MESLSCQILLRELLIFEPFVETDEIIISSKSPSENSHHLIWKGNNRWVEITVGVIGKRGAMQSLSPNVTVKESGDILSLEEKFQGGTGINLTPPPSSIMSNEALERCKQRIELIANTLGLEGFSRIDAFVNADSGESIENLYSAALGFRKEKYFDFVFRQMCIRLKDEYHGNNPEMSKLLHKAVRQKNESAFTVYQQHLANRPVNVLRDLLEFKSDRPSIPVGKVESATSIVQRLGGMSLGAISRETHEAIAIAMNRLCGKSNSRRW